jgi:hypothetical protein
MSTVCTYILKKGKNKGQPCGIKCVVNTLLCKKHSVDNDDNSSDNNNQNVETSQSNDENKNENKNENIIKSKESIKSKETKEKKEKKVKEPKEKKEKKEKEPKEKKEKEIKEIKEVSEKLNVYEKQKLQAKRNEYSNYVLSNNLVVHPVNKNIIGRQDVNKVIELSIEDIEYCKEHGLRYLQPSVLFFSDSDVEKKEVELLKTMIKSQNDKDQNKTDDDLDNYESDEEDEHEHESENEEDNDN